MCLNFSSKIAGVSWLCAQWRRLARNLSWGTLEAWRGMGSTGMGSWGGDSELLPHELYIGGLGKRCKLPQRGSGRSPDRKCMLNALRAQKRVSFPQMSFSCQSIFDSWGRGNRSAPWLRLCVCLKLTKNVKWQQKTKNREIMKRTGTNINIV